MGAPPCQATPAQASAETMTAEGLLVAEAAPPGPVAVTTTRTVLPTSAVTDVRVEPVAAAMSTQLAPDASQRRHW